MSNKFVICYQGFFSKDDVENVKKVFDTCVDFFVVVACWQSQIKLFHFLPQENIICATDPGSIKTKSGKYININRQITHWNLILERFPSHIIIKLRPDLRINSIKYFSNFIQDRIPKIECGSILVTNITTIYPLRWTPLAPLYFHYCDWVIIGHANSLKENLRNTQLNESMILCDKINYRLGYYSYRFPMAEQMIWRTPHDSSRYNKKKFLFFVYTLNTMSLISTKYATHTLRASFNAYSLLRMNNIECFLYNRRLFNALKMYIPVFRLLIQFVRIWKYRFFSNPTGYEL